MSLKGRNSVGILISKYEDATLLKYWHKIKQKEQSKIKTDNDNCVLFSFDFCTVTGTVRWHLAQPMHHYD